MTIVVEGREFIMHSISDAELQVLQILWEHGQMPYNQIAELLRCTGWSDSTIKTLLRRLIEKGAVAADRSNSRNYLYTAVLQQEQCQREQATDFLNRLFHGSISAMVSTLTKKQALSPKERQRLQQMLEEMEE